MALTLRGYWNMNETGTGTRASQVNGLTLTNNNSVTNGTGILNNASSFTAASSMYLSRANEANLQVGNVDFGISVWVKLTTKVRQYFVNKGDSSGSVTEYDLTYENTTDKFYFGANSGTNVSASTFGSPSTGVWYNVLGWQDVAGGTFNISINGGATNSAARTAGSVTTQPFYIGCFSAGLGLYVNGLIDEVALFTGKPSAGDKASIYGGGAPPAYSPTWPMATAGRRTLYGKSGSRGAMCQSRTYEKRNGLYAPTKELVLA